MFGDAFWVEVGELSRLLEVVPNRSVLHLPFNAQRHGGEYTLVVSGEPK
jgi:hypothetical protein